MKSILHPKPVQLISEPRRQQFEDLLHHVFKPEVSVPRQLIALVLLGVAFGFAVVIYGRVSYAYCHFLAGMGVLWLVYALSASPPAGAGFTVIASLYNEFVWDMAKPNHPNVDWDQLLAGFVGVAVGYLVLVALRQRWPGREWKKKPRGPIEPNDS